LNPGVIITEDNLAHVHNLKVIPIVEAEVDKCIECGFCESSCPSRDITLTPRRRIVVRRAIKRLETSSETEIRAELLKDYQFDGLDTCATDGLCATNCPVDINTGELVKRLRRENHSGFQNKMAFRLAQNFKLLEHSARIVLKTGFALNSVLGKNFMRNLTTMGRKGIPSLPLWSNQISKPPQFIENQFVENSLSVLYFSSCISRIMGGDILTTFLSVCQKANIGVSMPKNLQGTCCGQIFSSKGFVEAHHFTANQTIEKLYRNSQSGKIPIVMDVTSCTQTLKTCRTVLNEENKARFDQMTFIDVIDFAADILLPRLTISKPKDKIIFHPVCSVHKMGSMNKLYIIGKSCAKVAHLPTFAGCCGMGGDKGFYYPQLTLAATKIEANEVKQTAYDGYYSSSKTCEMALSEAVGKNYESILKLLDTVST
jgi:D-lactate dehydrogenase